MTERPSIELPEVWEAQQYVAPVAPEHGGCMAFTHLALLRNRRGGPVRGYVKHYTPQQPRGLFNEWLGYALMSALGVPQPLAAVMPAPLPGTDVVAWAFVSLQPTPRFEGTPKQLYNLLDPKQHRPLIERLMACPALPLLVAADQLLANDDRNMGNLVFTGKNQFVAIDHGGILGGTDWHAGDLWYTQHWERSKPIEDLVTIDRLSDKFKNTLLAAAMEVEDMHHAQQPHLRQALGAADNVDVATALQAVWWRAIALAPWFRNRLNLLT